MRVNCRFYESRSYPSGDTVRQCRLDLAPEAPWRCPENCPKFEPRMNDGGWVHGSLANSAVRDEPELDEGGVAMLDAAEDIINSVGPQIVDDVNRERNAQQKRGKQNKGQKKTTGDKVRRWWPF